jgi:uncharacterized protein
LSQPNRPSIASTGADALRNAGAYLAEFNVPVLRLGVTGLARAGKTVFIAGLLRNLIEGGRLPFFAPYAEGRISRAYLEPQPDDAVPRFDYEAHLSALASDPPVWPQSTSRISQVRVTLEFQGTGALRKFKGRMLGPDKLHVDIVDYPGEWLLDLGLLDRSYADWSKDAIAAARQPHHAAAAAPWLALMKTLDANGAADETVAREAAAVFTAYLQAARGGAVVATLGPGRFLLPGDLAGSPLLTFVPLDLQSIDTPRRDTLAAMMQRRYESYKREVIRPFFTRHFGRLDRQIVLVDALAAFDAGPAAIEDLTAALTAAFGAFRPGANSWGSRIISPRIDRIMFAATKADHLPRASHDRLEAALSLVTRQAMERAKFAGADVKVLALAALRSTRETEVRQGNETLQCIAGVPLPGEQLDTLIFDGKREAVLFPGDLPEDPALTIANGRGPDVRILRFRPPRIVSAKGRIESPEWPHIRLDRALDFLLGDRLA